MEPVSRRVVIVGGEKAFTARFSSRLRELSFEPTLACGPLASLANGDAVVYTGEIAGIDEIVAAIKASNVVLRAFVCTSSTEYYGCANCDRPVTEDTPAGVDDRARTVAEAETAAQSLEADGVRVVVLRIGALLGGTIRPLTGSAAARVPASFAPPKFVPWIHVDDAVEAYAWAVRNERASGAFNVVAPDFVSRNRFERAAVRDCAHVVGSDAALYGGGLVLPSRLEDAGFEWKHDRFEEAAPLQSLSFDQLVPGQLARIFPFFADPGQLTRLVPPYWDVRFVRGANEMQRGAIFEYVFSAGRLPIQWQTLVGRWQPPHRFTTFQLRGPYLVWRHDHTFHPIDGGVRVRDTITYALPAIPFARLAEERVRAEVERMIDFRQRTIEDRFGYLDPSQRKRAVAAR